MAQNRKPPAYQMYASDFMANRAYRVMSLPARGLFITMLNECWVNKNLPSNHNALAKVLGYPAHEVADSLPAVMAFFRVEGDDLICPELEDYREKLADAERRKREGGKVGAGITNEKRRANTASKPPGTPSGVPSSNPSSSPTRPELSRTELSRTELSRTELSRTEKQSLERDIGIDSFVSDYESMEADASAYLRASKG